LIHLTFNQVKIKADIIVVGQIQVISFNYTIQYFNANMQSLLQSLCSFLKQAAAWFLIVTTFSFFSIRYTQSLYQPIPVPIVDQPQHFLDLTMGCCSINKQSSIDSNLNWEGHHWVFISVSSDRSIRLATEIFDLKVILKKGK